MGASGANVLAKENQDQKMIEEPEKLLSKTQRSKIAENQKKSSVLGVRDRVKKPKMCNIRFQTKNIPAFKDLVPKTKPMIQAFSCPHKKSATKAPAEKTLEEMFDENESNWYSNPTYNIPGQKRKKVNAQGKCNIYSARNCRIHFEIF